MLKTVNIIVSCFNEEGNILPYFNEVKKYLMDKKYKYNVVYVNDGSKDNTYNEIYKIIKKTKTSKTGPKVSVISFKKNYGHEAAMCAGLELSKADYMVFMDVDIQHPPEKIPEIIKELEKGADCVLLRRVRYESVSLLKKITSNGYYLFSNIVLRNKNARNVSDFFAINKSLANKVKTKYKTRLRFIRGFIQNEAKKVAFIDYKSNVRNSGVSRYNYLKLTKLAIVSEFSRNKIFRDMYHVSVQKPIYKIDKSRTFM